MTGLPTRARLGRLPATQIDVGLPGEIAQLVTCRAAEAGMARSTWVRLLILDALGFPMPEVPAR